MSKLHRKTGCKCLICDDEVLKRNTYVLIHKTQRQTHKLCNDCFMGYIRPKLHIITENLRKNIRKDVHLINCPGSYHGKKRNICKYKFDLRKMNIKNISDDLQLDIFRILFVLDTPTAYLCPEQKCGQVVDVDREFTGSRLECASCTISWCRQCLIMPYHESKSCLEVEMENSTSENGKFIWEMKSKGLLKFCPQCRAPTIKNRGCSKMHCITCNCTWCWLCDEIGVDYPHYNADNNDRCSGKLWEGEDIQDL